MSSPSSSDSSVSSSSFSGPKSWAPCMRGANRRIEPPSALLLLHKAGASTETHAGRPLGGGLFGSSPSTSTCMSSSLSASSNSSPSCISSSSRPAGSTRPGSSGSSGSARAPFDRLRFDDATTGLRPAPGGHMIDGRVTLPTPAPRPPCRSRPTTAAVSAASVSEAGGSWRVGGLPRATRTPSRDPLRTSSHIVAYPRAASARPPRSSAGRGPKPGGRQISLVSCV